MTRALAFHTDAIYTRTPGLSRPELCTRCGVQPRLGALSRCKGCLRADARQDREQRDARARERPPATTKRCKACKLEKPLESFSLHPRSKDGYRYSCKACVRAGRAAAKPRTPAQSERTRVAAARPERRARNRVAVADWAARNPLAARARHLLRRAVRKGLVVKPATCQVEGCDAERIVAHHPDYSRPLSVLFTCRRHHRLLHNGMMLRLKAGVSRRRARRPKTC